MSTQQRSNVMVLMVLATLAVVTVSVAAAQQRRMVTVSELAATNHRLEVDVGTEIVFADPHFARVWFPRGGGPVLRRMDGAMAAVFDQPGEYKGVFTLVGGHAAGDVYPMTIVVKEASR
jgi:hypothetical protein